MSKRTCEVDGCNEQHYAKGYCRSHYWLWRKHGDPLINLRPDLSKTPQERFWEKVDKNGPISDRRPDLGPCWIWTGAKSGDYGCLRLPNERRTVGAHRWSYEQFVGPIPDGLHLDHLCHNPPCVRPDHLEPVTSGENMRRGDAPAAMLWRAGVCGKGHSMDDAYQMAAGYRTCRQCSLDKSRAAIRDPVGYRNRFNANPNAKYRQLTAEQVAEVERLWAAGGTTQRAIAERFGCSQSTVSAIVNGKRLNTHRPAA